MAIADLSERVIQESLEWAGRELTRMVPALAAGSSGTAPDVFGQGTMPRLAALAERGLQDLASDARRRDASAGLTRALSGRRSDCQSQRRGLATHGLQAGQLDGLVELSGEILAIDRQLEQVHRQRMAHYRRALHKGLPVLGAELAARANDWQDAERRLKDFFGTSAGLWDLDPGVWRKIDWTGLEAAAAWLEEWPELGELARLLGRNPGTPTEVQAPVSRGEVQKTDGAPLHWTEALGRSEINGYTRGNQLELLPAFETVLLSDPLTEGLFLKSHAEGTLTNIEYLTEVEHVVTRTGTLAVPPPPVQVGLGPVIICTDTSGSMAGLPERVAKALTLALVKACHAQGRGCWLIGFSTDIKSLDLSDPVRGIEEASAFLAHAFRGGTDLRPALARAIEVLDNPAWVRADLLIISDFRVPKLMIKKAAMIDPVRERHQARLHALSISAGDPVDDLHVFDSHWHFRIGGNGAALGIGDNQFRAQAGLFRSTLQPDEHHGMVGQ